ncbi:alpha/beta hydrolase [Eupransor demetentiae]|uniref:Uncharacterized conserved protein with an alpha/beta hydrolase fold n=1 Tax=Eupransor demetentiae TaxID=3109584 RepID=A0ABM9N466_9LACO|nr:Uncharacterized conserved protein with an alpha/beta hydrolase fold [Lactobacillaceae bacterium LMG 33000]
MKPKTIYTVLAVLVAIVVIALALVTYKKASGQTDVKPTEATVFFHGYGSSRNAEQSMSRYLVDKGYSNRRINVTVSKDSKVSFNRKAAAGDKHPIYLVQFNDNSNTDFAKTTDWVDTIMTQLHEQGITKVNLIGHSMGNMAIVYYLKSHSQYPDNLPRVERTIDIAGHFNGLRFQNDASAGLEANGMPSKETDSYRSLAGLEKYYENNKTKVLNIYGDSTGNGSDTTVPNNSSKSLRYFVRQPSTYQEKLITGKQAQHSKLHENKEVDQAIYDFLTK